MNAPIYTVRFADIAVTAVQDLFEILAPSTAALIILEFGLSQATELGDAQEEILKTTPKIVTGAPTSGSGGSSATPVAHSPLFSASGATVEVNNTTQISGGTTKSFRPWHWNVRQPDSLLLLPEARYIVSPSTRFVLSLDAAPSDSITLSGFVTYMEIGG